MEFKMKNGLSSRTRPCFYYKIFNTKTYATSVCLVITHNNTKLLTAVRWLTRIYDIVLRSNKNISRTFNVRTNVNCSIGINKIVGHKILNTWPNALKYRTLSNAIMITFFFSNNLNSVQFKKVYKHSVILLNCYFI